MAKIERTKNASRNIFFGIILKLYQMAVPFLMRTAIIYFMGIQYLGLNSLFASILQVLNLAELGVGSAMVYSMYKPIAEDDTDLICSLLGLYRRYYRIIGGFIAGIGIVVTPFIPRLISGDVPANINIYILYYLNLGATVLSYWMFAYYISIFEAHQRIDVVSKIRLITCTLQYGLQIFVLWSSGNYYYYVLVMLATQACTNIIVYVCAKNMYPMYKPLGGIEREKSKEINNRIKDLFTSKIGSIIYDSADTIVISAFLGLTPLAIYQNYYYILSSVTGFIMVVFSACTAGIGNSIVTETKRKNYSDFSKLTFIICWIAGVCSVCLLCLYQPFMEIWVGKEYMLSFSIVICLVIYFFTRQINALLNLYKDAAGMWHEDKYRPLTAAMTNLILNIILVRYIGLYGVVLSTVVAILLVGEPWLLHNLFTVIFEKKELGGYLKRISTYSIGTVLCCIITYWFCSLFHFSVLGTLVFRIFVCMIIPNLIFLFLYGKKEEYSQSLKLVNSITCGKIYGILKVLGMERCGKER